MLSSCLRVKLLSHKLRAYGVELSEVLEAHYVVRYYRGAVDYGALEADQETGRLDQAEAEHLGDQRLERQVLVEVDARENRFDLGNARALRVDRYHVADEGAGECEEYRGSHPQAYLQVEPLVGAHEADSSGGERHLPVKRV